MLIHEFIRVIAIIIRKCSTSRRLCRFRYHALRSNTTSDSRARERGGGKRVKLENVQWCLSQSARTSDVTKSQFRNSVQALHTNTLTPVHIAMFDGRLPDASRRRARNEGGDAPRGLPQREERGGRATTGINRLRAGRLRGRRFLAIGDHDGVDYYEHRRGPAALLGDLAAGQPLLPVGLWHGAAGIFRLGSSAHCLSVSLSVSLHRWWFAGEHLQWGYHADLEQSSGGHGRWIRGQGRLFGSQVALSGLGLLLFAHFLQHGLPGIRRWIAELSGLPRLPRRRSVVTDEHAEWQRSRSLRLLVRANIRRRRIRPESDKRRPDLAAERRDGLALVAAVLSRRRPSPGIIPELQRPLLRGWTSCLVATAAVRAVEFHQRGRRHHGEFRQPGDIAAQRGSAARKSTRRRVCGEWEEQ